MQLGCEREHAARAGVAERVPQGDGAAVGVQPVVGNLEARLRAELAQHGEDLGGERLMDLVHVDLIRGQSGLLDRAR